MASSRYYIFTSRFRLVRSRKGEVKSSDRISGFIPHSQMRQTFVIKDFTPDSLRIAADELAGRAIPVGLWERK